jgi:hypothetical protein
MKNALRGRKTYLVSLLTAALGVIQLLNGHSYSQVLPYLLGGALGGSLRAAIAKVEEKVLSALPKPVETLVKPVVDAEIQKVEGQ